MEAPTRRSRITPEREAELYGAVLDLLREVGYEALTMDAVAARTRSSKATLYRQWGSKAELVVRTLRHHKPGGSVTEIDTGSLRGDLYRMVAHTDEAEMEKNSALMRGLVHAAHDNPELMRAFRDLLIDPELNGLNEMLRRAVARGEVGADRPALAFVPHMLVGAFVACELVEGRVLTQAFMRGYLEAVVFPSLGI
ncbi:TetR/AcrR family transcriptional regulator [Streptomyces sp. GC420]|uniref:TetR/AcrR family transcriptional regulator n=1 Tax=Streptomyces sp. GC420 TaxID=2697568 RepID=UPI0014151490|nr:TetR/AcrR family transcriptional regulator [Streptomyces sp. GC420]NBM19223.1 TetR family transcriptional regulator [Streptomyces sp. GC420]